MLAKHILRLKKGTVANLKENEKNGAGRSVKQYPAVEYIEMGIKGIP